MTVWMVLATSALAMPVDVDPGAFASAWRVDGSGWLTGAQTVDVSVGTHTMWFQSGSGVTVEVDASGQWVQLPTDSYQAIGTLLELNNVSVDVDPDGWAANWIMSGSGWQNGPGSVVVVPDVTTYLWLQSSGALQFRADATGLLDAPFSGAYTVSGSQLTFENRTVQFDPADYDGAYWEPGGWAVGPSQATLVPEIGTQVWLQDGGALTVRVDVAGQLEDLGSVSYTRSSNLAVFETRNVRVDPDGYAGAWHLPDVGWSTGAQQLDLVAGIPQQLWLQGGSAQYVEVDAAGGLVDRAPESYAVSGSDLLMHNVDVEVDDGGAGFSWWLSGTLTSGTQTRTLIPGFSYEHHVVGSFQREWIAVSNTAVTPGSHLFDVGGIGYPYVYRVVPSNAPPTVDAGPDQVVHADGSCRGVVQLNATGSDPDGDTLTYTWDDGSAGPSPVVALPLGDHVLTVTVSDGNGGRAQDSVLISVVDATPPSVDGSALGSTALWPPNHSMHVVGNVGSVLVTDNCDPATEVTWALFSDERDNAQGDGDTTCDASIDGLGDLHVRAERQGSGDGRVVTLVAVAEDASGNIVDWSGVVATVPPSAAARAVDSGTWYEPTCP